MFVFEITVCELSYFPSALSQFGLTCFFDIRKNIEEKSSFKVLIVYASKCFEMLVVCALKCLKQKSLFVRTRHLYCIGAPSSFFGVPQASDDVWILLQ